MFAKMLHRYPHLGEKLVALYYTGWTRSAIHEDGKADLARERVRALGGYPDFSCNMLSVSAFNP